ncbi:MAG: hypothetical protein AAFN10_09420 [Bacteroidota bacterium]
MENPLFDRLKDYRTIIWRRRWWFGGLGLLLALIFGYREYNTPTEYIAAAKFHPESDGASSINLENPVSLLFGGGMVPEESQNMIGILKSRRIAEAVVSDTIVVHIDTFFVFDAQNPYGIYLGDGGRDTVWLQDKERFLLADKALSIFYGEPSLLQKILAYFSEPQAEASLTNKVYRGGKQLGKRMAAYVGEEGFIDFSVTVADPVFAKILADKYILALRTYYQNQKTEKAKRNLDFFTIRADSVKGELDKVNRQIASFVDKSRYRIRASEEVLPRELEATSSILQQMYINLMISRESAVSQLLETTPILQVLDYPRGPFNIQKGSVIKGIVLGFFIAFFVLLLWFTRKLYWADLKKLINNSLAPPPSDSAY